MWGEGFAYTWYNPDPVTNGGGANSQGIDTYGGSLPDGLCNTQAYAAAVNALAIPLCGKNDLATTNPRGTALDCGLFGAEPSDCRRLFPPNRPLLLLVGYSLYRRRRRVGLASLLQARRPNIWRHWTWILPGSIISSLQK